jgi:hypothetical protein
VSVFTHVAADRLSPAADSPVFPPERVAPGYSGSVVRYGDPVWPLAPLIENPSAMRNKITWDTFPAATREELRPIAWTMIQSSLPNSFLRERAGSWTPRTSAPAIYNTLWWWRSLARWLDGRGIETIGGLSHQLQHDFDAWCIEQGNARNTVNKMLRACA